MEKKFGVLLIMISALLLLAPYAMAVGIVSSGVSSFTATGNDRILQTITYNSIIFGNPDYSPYDVELETGTSSMYDNAGTSISVDPTFPIVNADNFELSNTTTFRNETDDYMETVFVNPVQLFFIIDGAFKGSDNFTHDAGSVQGYDNSGNPLTQQYHFDNTEDWYATGFTGNTRNLGLLAFDAGLMVDRLRIYGVTDIEENGLDPVSVSGAAVPIPGAAWLLGSGLIGLVAIRRRLKQ